MVLFFLLFFFIGTFIVKPAAAQASENAPEQLYAVSACLMDASSQRLLFEKNAFQVMPMASTTKIMTLLLALEYDKPNELVTVSSYAASMPDVQLGIREGETYLLGDLLYAMMLESHNDVAVAIAEHIGGSVTEFAKQMNAKALSIGAYHTKFVTPNGLDADGHASTAADMALIASYAIKNESLQKIIQTSTYSFSETNGKRNFSVNNKNRFLYLMEGALGMKTGFTGKAGYCFVGALSSDQKTLISVVLACGWPPHKDYKWKDTEKLMRYGLNNFEIAKLSEYMTESPQVPIKNGTQEMADTYISFTDVNFLIDVNNESVETEIHIIKDLTAPVSAGTTVGSMIYRIGGTIFRTYDIKLSEAVQKRDYFYELKTAVYRYFCLFHDYKWLQT